MTQEHKRSANPTQSQLPPSVYYIHQIGHSRHVYQFELFESDLHSLVFQFTVESLLMKCNISPYSCPAYDFQRRIVASPPDDVGMACFVVLFCTHFLLRVDGVDGGTIRIESHSHNLLNTLRKAHKIRRRKYNNQEKFRFIHVYMHTYYNKYLPTSDACYISRQ